MARFAPGCAFCTKEVITNNFPCDCGKMVYCSVYCKTADWVNHKSICGLLKTQIGYPMANNVEDQPFIYIQQKYRNEILISMAIIKALKHEWLYVQEMKWKEGKDGIEIDRPVINFPSTAEVKLILHCAFGRNDFTESTLKLHPIIIAKGGISVLLLDIYHPVYKTWHQGTKIPDPPKIKEA